MLARNNYSYQKRNKELAKKKKKEEKRQRKLAKKNMQPAEDQAQASDELKEQDPNMNGGLI